MLPQPIRSGPAAGKNLTEKAWLPLVKFDANSGEGFASGYLAYDDQNFYFAAKIADAKPYEGNVRFANRDENADFYPETSLGIQADGKLQELHWPGGVRRFSYRRSPAVPAGEETENVQLGFNVLPVEKTDWLSHPAGTMPKFTCYKTTDYEYALNKVADQFGGGTELWRLLAPACRASIFIRGSPRCRRRASTAAPSKAASCSLPGTVRSAGLNARFPGRKCPKSKRSSTPASRSSSPSG